MKEERIQEALLRFEKEAKCQEDWRVSGAWKENKDEYTQVK